MEVLVGWEPLGVFVFAQINNETRRKIINWYPGLQIKKTCKKFHKILIMYCDSYVVFFVCFKAVRSPDI